MESLYQSAHFNHSPSNVERSCGTLCSLFESEISITLQSDGSVVIDDLAKIGRHLMIGRFKINADFVYLDGVHIIRK